MNFNNIFPIALLFLLVITTFANAQNWNLIWADEFNTNGNVNQEKWFQQTQLPNGYSWYNNELQHYTDEIENSYVSNGTLKIVAIKENYTDQGHTKPYTSARLNSKFAFTYGKVEVRAKLPSGQGTWPAIWTLGKNISEPEHTGSIKDSAPQAGLLVGKLISWSTGVAIKIMFKVLHTHHQVTVGQLTTAGKSFLLPQLNFIHMD